MKTLLGKIVVFHMNMEQQVRAGGSHTPAINNGLQHAPAIVTRDLNPEITKEVFIEQFEDDSIVFVSGKRPPNVNLKVLCDSRDDIWVKDVSYGSGAGQWEFIEETELKDNKIEKFQEEPLEPRLEITRH